MLNPRVKLRHLIAFQEVARLRSMVKAAQSLSISQPAMSKTIRELEEVLDAELFERSSAGVALTAAGMTLLRHAGPALRSLGDGIQAVRHSAERSVVRLGVLSTVERHLLPTALLRLGKINPGTRVQAVTGPSAYLLSRLSQGELDMVVGRMSEAREIRGLTFEHFYREPLVLAVRSGHPLVEDPNAGERLMHYPWVVPLPSTTLREQVERFWVEQGGWTPTIALETLSLWLGREYMMGSDAIWVAPWDAVHQEVDAGVVAQLPVALEPQGGSVGVSTNITLPLSHAAREVYDCLVLAAAENRTL